MASEKGDWSVAGRKTRNNVRSNIIRNHGLWMDYELEREVTNELDDVTGKWNFWQITLKRYTGVFCFPQKAEIW